MREALEKLAASELQALATEIVQSLDGAARGGEAPFSAENGTAILRALRGEAPLAESRLRLAFQAAVAALAQPAADFSAAELAAGTGAEVSADGVSAAARGAAARMDAFSQGVSAKRQDIAALSEYFRRDSRRYDVGFERF